MLKIEKKNETKEMRSFMNKQTPVIELIKERKNVTVSNANGKILQLWSKNKGSTAKCIVISA